MIFRVRAYEKDDGECPVREFIESQRASNPKGYGLLVAGINKLRDRKYHREPVCKVVDDELREMRVLSSGVRVLFAFRPKALVVLLLGVVKKKDKLDRSTILQARSYLSDYLQRCTHDEDEIDEEF